MRLWFAIAAVLLTPGMVRAGPTCSEVHWDGPPEEELKYARDAFQFGDYAKALCWAEDLINKNNLANGADRVEVRRIAGMCSYYRRDKIAAEDHFHRLLQMNPDYQLDPFYTPPQAVQFLDDVRKQFAVELEAIREQRKASQAEQEARLKASQEAAKVQTVYRDVEHNDRLLAFLPLGIGQFQNGDTGLGIAVGTVQTISAGTSLGCWLAVALMNYQHPGPGLPDNLAPTAKTLNVIAPVAGGVFFATWIYSTVQALSGFQPTREVPGGTRSSGEKSEGNKVSSIAPFVVPTSGGGIAGLGLGF